MDSSVVPKFTLLDRSVCPHHRSGWSCALEALEPLLTSDGTGILFESFLYRRFGRLLREGRSNGELPYQRPWVGVVHVPPSVPRWAHYRYSPSYYFRLRTWQASMPFCRGLITLSTRMKRWLEERVDVPVLGVKHPTPTPPVRFDYAKFLRNPDRRLIHVGWWLRRFASFHRLPTDSPRKTLLLPFADDAMRSRILPIIERDLVHHNVPPLHDWNVDILPYQNHAAYDRLLSENIVFLHLYETVANNAILECIVRHTPVLVNPLHDVVEYLGPQYPLYFDDLDEAAEKAQDLDLIRQAHEYLRDMPKDDLTAESFRNSIANSELYRGL
jgi:hypothetical protein